MEAMKEGCSIKGVAEEHNMPRIILQDQILGRVKHGSKLGPVSY